MHTDNIRQFVMKGEDTDKVDVTVTMECEAFVMTPRRRAPRRSPQYKPETGAGDFIEIEMGKDAAPRVLATLEARSGKKIDRSGGGS